MWALFWARAVLALPTPLLELNSNTNAVSDTSSDTEALLASAASRDHLLYARSPQAQADLSLDHDESTGYQQAIPPQAIGDLLRSDLASSEAIR